MNVRLTVNRILSLAAACALLTILAGSIATAQIDNYVSVSNNTKCAVTVCFGKGNCITFEPGESRRVDVRCDGIVGIFVCGVLRTLGPGHDFLSNVDIGGGCCADVAYSPGFVGCTWFLSFDQTAGPCKCDRLD